jgi:hypothetical protein
VVQSDDVGDGTKIAHDRDFWAGELVSFVLLLHTRLFAEERARMDCELGPTLIYTLIFVMFMCCFEMGLIVLCVEQTFKLI